MRLFIIVLITSILPGCFTTIKYPLHDVLKEQSQMIGARYVHFCKTEVRNGVTDTVMLSTEEFEKLAANFSNSFPDVSNLKGRVETQDHKYQGKRKFIEFSLDAAAGEKSEAMVMFHIDKQDNEPCRAFLIRKQKMMILQPVIRLNIEYGSNILQFRKEERNIMK